MALFKVIPIILVVMRLNLVSLSPLPRSTAPDQMQCGVLAADPCDGGTEAEGDDSHQEDDSTDNEDEDEVNDRLDKLRNLKLLFEGILERVKAIHMNVGRDVTEQLDADYGNCVVNQNNGSIFHTATQQSMELVAEALNLTSGWLHQMHVLGNKSAEDEEIEGSPDQLAWMNLVNVVTGLHMELNRAACEFRLSRSTVRASIPSCPSYSDEELDARLLLPKLQRILQNRICYLLSTDAATAATSSTGVVQSV